MRKVYYIEGVRTGVSVRQHVGEYHKGDRTAVRIPLRAGAQLSYALIQRGFECGIVYSDEHYNGDVPYLGGNTNISIEPVAGVIGRSGFHILAGLEGGYVAEQLAPRSGAKVHKVEMLKLADEDYPIDAEQVQDVIEEAAGCTPGRIALLTPRAVFPVGRCEDPWSRFRAL